MTQGTLLFRTLVLIAAIALALGVTLVTGDDSNKKSDPATRDAESAKPQVELPRVLVFSKTAGFRHASIPDGVRCLKELGAERFLVDSTEDANAFTKENLARYRAVVWLSTTGDVLTDEQQGAFESFIKAGGGFVGIHSASDTEYEWPWYGELVGAYFKTHPPVQRAMIGVETRDHSSTTMLPEHWERTDEWYGFRTNPRTRHGLVVLMTLDESTYAPGEGSAMGADHPIAWFQSFDGGRAWYTGGGHTSESFTEPLFRAHLLGGILWAAGLEK